MSLFEQTPSRGGSRFGKLSTNMFFTRNTAKPKRVRHIEGLNGALICNVNDDPSVIRSTPTSSLNFNKTNLPTFETPRRVERLVPPMGFWNTYGIIQDTERWKQELAALATASGLGIEKDEHKSTNSNKPPPTTATAVDQQHASRSGAHYSTRTGRFNEGAGTSRGRTSSKHATAYSDSLFNVPENEREMWMLQVLCQLLSTSNLEDVQSWLVSASQTEKDQARFMIHSALRGLKESERTTNQSQENVDLNALSNFVERQKNEEKYASQKYVKDTLNRSLPILPLIDEEQQTDISLSDTIDNSKNNLDTSQQNITTTTTYKRAFQNYNQRSNTSFDSTSSNKKNDLININEEEIDTIQLDDDRQRSQSDLLIKPSSKKPSSSSIGRPPSSHKQKHHVESMQFNDDENIGQNLNITNENEDEQQQQQQQQQQEISSLSNKTKPLSNQDENNSDNKSRKIRRLQHKLSTQEEETKKKFTELQSKQSRLENALKLLVKQTKTFKKRREQTNDAVEDLDVPVVNVIIQSPRDTDKPPSVQSNGKSQKNRNGNSEAKMGDYKIEDVKVQISLSRQDNHSAKVYSGVWKPDASTLHRLQGN